LKKITGTGHGLMIGIPTLGRPLTLDWAMAFKGLCPPINYNYNHMVVKNQPVDVAREAIAEKALEQGNKYLFFLGDDVVVPNPTLRQLIFRMEQNPKIGVVGGVYCSKSDPPAPLVFRENGMGSYWDWKAGEFFQVSGLGMDCTLIRTEVLSKMSKPWFKTVDTDQFKDGVNQADMWTEDLYFLNKLSKETDFEIWCDGSLICGHEDVYTGKTYSLSSNSLPLRRMAVNGLKRAIDIGCGPLDRSPDFPEYTLVRVDIREECNPDYRCDVTELPFGNAEFDLIFSSHVLEHFSREKWKVILTEWLRVLKPGGDVFFVLPNVKWAIDNFSDAKQHINVMNVLYGGQSNDYDFHYNGWWPEKVIQVFKEFGCTTPTIEHNGYNMMIKARKAGKALEPEFVASEFVPPTPVAQIVEASAARTAGKSHKHKKKR
jgi:SAM-dependent methyltransferase